MFRIIFTTKRCSDQIGYQWAVERGCWTPISGQYLGVNLKRSIATLYIAEKCLDDPDFTVTRLNKILFWADFRSFAQYGKSITGARYKALEHGPAPARLDVIS